MEGLVKHTNVALEIKEVSNHSLHWGLVEALCLDRMITTLNSWSALNDDNLLALSDDWLQLFSDFITQFCWDNVRKLLLPFAC